jgi:hypothetical protein
MVGKKKKAQAAKAAATIAKKASRRGKVGMKEERRARKLEKRRKEKKTYTAEMWAAPAPSHLIAKLDIPKVKSKYQSYFEFAENTEKKKKKLEFTAGFKLPTDTICSQFHRLLMIPTHLRALPSSPSGIRPSQMHAKSYPGREML